MRKIFVFVALLSVLAACSDDDQPAVELPKDIVLETQTAVPGEILTINGNGFLVNETYVVTFADNVVGKITEITANYIKVEIPADAVSGEITLTYKDQTTVVGNITIFVNLDLYAYKRNYTDPNNYITQIVKVDKQTGKETVAANFTVNSSYYEYLVFDNAGKNILGLDGDDLLKVNIQTGTSAVVKLPGGDGMDYSGLTIDDSGNVYAYKRNYADPNNYIKQIVKIDKQTGTETLVANLNIEPTYYEYLVFDKVDKNIIGVVENSILKVNIQTGASTTVTLPGGEDVDYSGLTIDDSGTLYAYKRNYADPNNYIKQIVKVDKQNGRETLVANLNMDATYYDNLVFDNAQKSILGLVENTVVKVDVQTGKTTTVNLQNTDGMDYRGLVLGK